MADYTYYLAHGKNYTFEALGDKTFTETITFMDGTTMVLGDKTFDNLQQVYTYQAKN